MGFGAEPGAVGQRAERAKGQAWGVRTVESFHLYGTPPTDADRTYARAAGVADGTGQAGTGAASSL